MTDNNNIQELNVNEMNQISGGVQRVINTNCSDNAAIRSAPTRGQQNQIASLPNGTIVNTINENNLTYDAVSGRNFVQIQFIDKYGVQRTGWVAASIVGLKR